MLVCVTQLFLHESAEIGHIPLPPMAGVGGGGGKEQGCRHGNYVFSCRVISQTETDAMSNIRTHEQHTLTKEGIVGAKLNTVDRVTQCYHAVLLQFLLFHSAQVFKVPLQASYYQSTVFSYTVEPITSIQSTCNNKSIAIANPIGFRSR